tara:strand:- start:34066 stop:34266 length:201 start_codon:yes stop_codon:yes gene_type:complete
MDIDISAADTANVTLLFTGNLRRPVFGIFPGWMKFLIFIGFVDPIFIVITMTIIFLAQFFSLCNEY